ncbi:MAG: type 1 glutamine amidotransferase [Candidatus Saccharibacteria bacterium]|nr:type 1 glutamine amidotransferase [Candidatus Saccharibacteria bacterium]
MSLNGRKIAIIATDAFEDSELADPMQAVKDAGADITVISNKSGEITGENGTEVLVDKTVDEVSARDYDGLLIPGGVKNPDIMRTNKKAVQFVRDFFEQHKPVAAICHGPWLLVEADVVDGRTLTSWPSLQTDIKNAGGNWVDEEVVVDQGLVTSRKPDDLPAFCAKAVEEFEEGKHKDQIA